MIAITGASGAVYATRLLQLLSNADRQVHLTISPSGAAVIYQELGLTIDVRKPDLPKLLSTVPKYVDDDGHRETAEHAATLTDQFIRYHAYDDYMTPIASGSFRTAAMVVCPCSGSTLSGIARASASNLIQRAAEVHLKEHRKLILVPRETPMSVLQLENATKLAAAGAVLLPAMPGFYHPIDGIGSLVDFVVGRILDQLDVPIELIKRWGAPG